MSFAKDGPKPENSGRTKGTKNKSTLIKERLRIQSWSELNAFIEGPGIRRLVQEMNALKGKDYERAFTAIAEFVKPKLSRTEVLADIKTDIHWHEVKNYEKKPDGTDHQANTGH